MLQQLARLRRRERWLRILWGIARWLSLVAAILALACWIDWTVDRRQETPWVLRITMALGQAIIAVIAGVKLFRPLFQRLSDSFLALWVEEKIPSFGHRLISAVQLNRPEAAIQGMSPELIARVTREAEEQAARHDFALTADHRRLRWSASLGIPFILGCTLLVALRPETIFALVSRQFLADREIPRSIWLESVKQDLVWPSGEEVVLRFRAKGDVFSDDLQGEVRIEPVGRDAANYPLVRETKNPDGNAIYLANVPPSTVDFSYRAWLGDGRTRHPGYVRFEPQPAIIEQRAWLQIPMYYGLRPDGKPYEEEQVRGDIFGIPNCSARVVIKTQKPIVQAVLELLGQPGGIGNQPNKPLEIVRRKLDLTLLEESDYAEATFALQPEETAYRIVVRDRYGFQNVDPPRRSIRIISEEIPQVALLPEQFPEFEDRGPSEDFEVEGIPVPLGGSIRIAYGCRAPYGLGRAQLRYRVNEGQWWPLPLKEVLASPHAGRFDPRRGVFENSGFLDQVEFHAVPSSDPQQLLGRKEGGGRFDFQTRRLPDLKVGDKIEFHVEVFDRNPDLDRPPGRSETRMKAIVTAPDLETWVRETLQEENRIRQLESKQRGVFGKPGTSDPDEPTTLPRGTVPSVRSDPPRFPAGEVFSFVQNWQLIGPFPNPDDSGFNSAYPPESDKVDLGKEYEGLKGKIRWKLYRSHGSKIDLERFFNHSDSGVAYALCWVQSKDRRSAILATGSDDGIQVWLNRKKAVTKRVHREATAGEDKTPVELVAGWNELLVKVDNTFGTWAFFIDFRDPRTGKMLEGLKYRTTPPEDDDLKFVRNWQVLGPFPNPNQRGRDTVYRPETERVDLNKEYEGIGGKVCWQALFNGSEKIDLETFFNRAFNESNVAYAVCWVRSEKKKSAVITTGSVDGIKVWMNRKNIINRAGNRELNPGADEENVELETGWNEILVKADNKFGRWAFYLELRDPETERPLEGIEFRISPP